VECVPSSKVVLTADSLYIPSTNPKNSLRAFELWPEIKIRHQIFESDAGLKKSPFLFGFFC
jgi:hypothetical protein